MDRYLVDKVCEYLRPQEVYVYYYHDEEFNMKCMLFENLNQIKNYWKDQGYYEISHKSKLFDDDDDAPFNFTKWKVFNQNTEAGKFIRYKLSTTERSEEDDWDHICYIARCSVNLHSK